MEKWRGKATQRWLRAASGALNWRVNTNSSILRAYSWDKIMCPRTCSCKNPPAVCRAFPWDWPPARHKETEPSVAFSPHFTQQPRPSFPAPSPPSISHPLLSMSLSRGGGQWSGGVPCKPTVKVLLTEGTGGVGRRLCYWQGPTLLVSQQTAGWKAAGGWCNPPGESHRGVAEDIMCWGKNKLKKKKWWRQNAVPQKSRRERREGWLAPALPNLISVHDCPTERQRETHRERQS